MTGSCQPRDKSVNNRCTGDTGGNARMTDNPTETQVLGWRLFELHTHPHTPTPTPPSTACTYMHEQHSQSSFFPEALHSQLLRSGDSLTVMSHSTHPELQPHPLTQATTRTDNREDRSKATMAAAYQLTAMAVLLPTPPPRTSPSINPRSTSTWRGSSSVSWSTACFSSLFLAVFAPGTLHFGLF